jgi:beta-glucosidase
MYFITLIVALLCALSIGAANVALEEDNGIPIPSRVESGKVFPAGFNFGVSTSSYQVEGAWLADGKGMSIWDTYSHTPGMIANGDTGDVANEHYYKFKEDFALMAKYGIKHYRFSIPWNRILPTGVAPINQKAIDHYNEFINSMIENGIEPHVTIYHSETPLALTMYPNNPMPFLDGERFPGWFTDYAKVLFDSFGDRVKHWFTFNEPFCTSVFGTYGDKDPYQIAHNAILAHASVYKLYKTSYLAQQKGTVGIVLNTAHFYPQDKSSPEDVQAAQRGYDFWYGWFMDPLTKGSYPESMQKVVGDRLPKFTPEQKELITGALDFVALNYYFPYIASPGTAKQTDEPSFWKDMNVTQVFDPSWPISETGWGIYGPGLRDLLIYTDKK